MPEQLKNMFFTDASINEIGDTIQRFHPGFDKETFIKLIYSEGCRPRLPWAMALPKFKKNPAPILPVLEILKDDPSEDVRRSAANNLNDISKDNPEVTLDICEKWYGQNKNVDAIVKHACRTMLKAGNKRAMILFGFGDPTHMKVENLITEKDTITIGEEKAKTSFELRY